MRDACQYYNCTNFKWYLSLYIYVDEKKNTSTKDIKYSCVPCHPKSAWRMIYLSNQWLFARAE
jgi:hypothetical protein